MQHNPEVCNGTACLPANAAVLLAVWQCALAALRVYERIDCGSSIVV